MICKNCNQDLDESKFYKNQKMCGNCYQTKYYKHNCESCGKEKYKDKTCKHCKYKNGKKCSKCKKILDLSNFRERKTNKEGDDCKRYYPSCKKCDLEYTKEYVNRNRERVTKWRRKYYEKRPKINQRQRIKQKLKKDCFNSVFDMETKVNEIMDIKHCECCGVSFDNAVKCIDHNHKDNTYRGCLCLHCNFILGHARDSVDILLNAMDYLKVRG